MDYGATEAVLDLLLLFIMSKVVKSSEKLITFILSCSSMTLQRYWS